MSLSSLTLNDHVLNEDSRDRRSTTAASRNARSSSFRAAATRANPPTDQMIPKRSFSSRKMASDSVQLEAAPSMSPRPSWAFARLSRWRRVPGGRAFEPVEQRVAQAYLVEKLRLGKLDRERQPGIVDLVDRPAERRPEVRGLARLPLLGQEVRVVPALDLLQLARFLELG